MSVLSASVSVECGVWTVDCDSAVSGEPPRLTYDSEPPERRHKKSSRSDRLGHILLDSDSDYCTISNCSAKGVTRDRLDEFAPPARCIVREFPRYGTVTVNSPHSTLHTHSRSTHSIFSVHTQFFWHTVIFLSTLPLSIHIQHFHL